MNLIDDLKAFREISKFAPFHFAASADTVRALEQRVRKEQHLVHDSRFGGINAFNGVQIFIDDTVAFGQIEKRPGARPEKESAPAVSAAPRSEVRSDTRPAEQS